MKLVSDIMIKNPIICGPSTSLEHIASLMLNHNCGEITIVDSENRPIGVVTDRDICIRSLALGKNPLSMRAIEIMSTPVVSVTPDASLDKSVALMELKLIRRLPVVDENGKCCGIISYSDIARVADDALTSDMVFQLSRPTPIDYTH